MPAVETNSMSTPRRTALVTGASSGIGLAIARMLVSEGYEVYGIARHFDKNTDYGFNTIICDVTDTAKLLTSVSKIDKPEIIVNCAGVGFYGLHENLTLEQIKQMVRTNLEAPMILTGYFLPSFKREGRGTIINISSVTAYKTNTYGAAYGAVKSGLSSFSASLFEEARKHGVKVIEICPDMTNTNLYRNADFTVDDDPMCRLDADDVADAVKSALQMSSHSCVTKVSIVPQKMRIKRRNVNEDRSE